MKDDPVLLIFKLTIYAIIAGLITVCYYTTAKLECQAKMVNAGRNAEDIVTVCGEF